MNRERQLALWQSRILRWREFDAESQSAVAECFDAAYVSRMKVPDTEPLPTKRPVKVSDPWRHEWQRGVQVPVLARQEQPKPCVRHLDNSEDEECPDNAGAPSPGRWRLPHKLLTSLDDYTFDPDTQEISTGPPAIRPGELEPRCRRYCCDELDRLWLEAATGAGSASVSMDSLEALFTAAEALAHERMLGRLRTVAGLGIEYDTTVPCSVCQSLEVEEDNEILFCDGCDTPVHQACYGVASVPSGSWLCRPCSLGLRPVCALCSSSGGAMKSTRDGVTWCHVSCALWIPEVGFADPERMEPITRLNEIPTGRWNLVCRLCREKVGACIQCCVRQCKVAFHVTCAFRHKLVMRQVLSGGDVRNLAYCERHGDKFKQTGVTPHSSPSKARPKYKGVGGDGCGSGKGRGRGRKRGRPPSAARTKPGIDVIDGDGDGEATADVEDADADASQDCSLSGEAKRARLDEAVQDAVESAELVKSEPTLNDDGGACSESAQTKTDQEIGDSLAAAVTSNDPSDNPDGQENQRNQLLKDLEANFYNLFSKEELVAKMAPVKVDARALSLLLDYWKLKRTANACRPLLEQPDDQSLRPVNSEERRLQERAQMFVCLRHDMERVRNLCYLILRREKVKRSLLITAERISALQLKPTRKNKSLRRLRPEDWRLLADAHIGQSLYENQRLLRSLLQPAQPAEERQPDYARSQFDKSDIAEEREPVVEQQPQQQQPMDPDCLDPSEICLTDGDYRRLGRERRDGGLLASADVVGINGDVEMMTTTTLIDQLAAPTGTQQRRQVARRRRRRRVDAAAAAADDNLSAPPNSSAEQVVAEATRALRQLPARALRVAESLRRQLRAGLRDPMFRSLVADCPSSSDEDDDNATVEGLRVDGNSAANDVKTRDPPVASVVSNCVASKSTLIANDYIAEKHEQPDAGAASVNNDGSFGNADASPADENLNPDVDADVDPDADEYLDADADVDHPDADKPVEREFDAMQDDGEPTPTPPPMTDTPDPDAEAMEELSASCSKTPPKAIPLPQKQQQQQQSSSLIERSSSGNIFEKLSKA